VTAPGYFLGERHMYMNMNDERHNEIVVSNQHILYDRYRIPGVVGILDCTHISIISPRGDTAEIDRNRRCDLSINVQGNKTDVKNPYNIM